MADFTQIIESARRVAGLSYEGWAETSFSNPSFLYRVCTGKARPSRDMLIRLGLGLRGDERQINLLLQAAGKPGLNHIVLGDSSRRDRLIGFAIRCQLSVPQTDELLRVAGHPGLLESSRRPTHPEWSARDAA